MPGFAAVACRRSAALLLSVTFQMMPGCVLAMFGGVKVMPVGEVRVMSGLLVVACIVVFRRFGVVMRGHTVMMGRMAVFMRCLL